MELNKLEHSNVRLRTHSRNDCKGGPCAIHRRTKHFMRKFPQHWRNDRGIMERICSCGIGHPDPDDYKIRMKLDSGDHGCCGCCSPEF